MSQPKQPGQKRRGWKKKGWQAREKGSQSAGQALQSILDGGLVAQGAVLAGAVVEADVVLKEPLPLLQRSWAGPVPELLLDSTLHPLHLTVEVGAPGLDAGVADAQAFEQGGEIKAELGAVVRLDAAQGEGERFEERWKGATDGGGGALLQHSGPQVAAAVVNEGELVAFLGKVLEVHLGPLSGDSLGVANPDWFRFARPQRQSPAAAQHPVDAAQAAANEAGLLQVGVQPAHSPAQLPLSAANDVQNLSGEGARATPRSPRPSVQGLLPLPLPSGPPAGEGGVGDLRSRAEGAGPHPP